MHESEIKGYRIERLNKYNLKDLDALYKKLYGHDPPGLFFQKKYDTAYTGAECLGYFAYNRQNVAIAYYGVLPCFIEYENKLFLSAQSGDTMTHPEYRGRGLFVELGNMTIDLCRKEKIRLLFGFPNQQSYPGFINRLGWTSTDTMRCFCIPVRALPLASISNRLAFLRGIYHVYAASVLKKKTLPGQALINSALNEGFGGVHRNTPYFNYKTYSPTRVIRIGKAKAWVKTHNDLIIGDLELAGQDFDLTIETLKKLATSLGIRHIYFHSSPGTLLNSLFEARYPGISSFPVIFRDLGADIPLNRLKFTFADIDTF